MSLPYEQDVVARIENALKAKPEELVELLAEVAILSSKNERWAEPLRRLKEIMLSRLSECEVGDQEYLEGYIRRREKEIISREVARFDGNKENAALNLGISTA